MSVLSLRRALPAVALIFLLLARAAVAQAPAGFTISQTIDFPFASELVAAPAGSRIAWVLFERGARNIYVAEGPTFSARKITSYTDDDGQELTNVSISPDGRTVVYARGGDHGSNWPAEGGLQPDPNSSPVQPQVEIYAVPFAGGTPKRLAQGDLPVISPRGDRVAYVSNGQIWTVPIDGSATGKRLFFDRGRDGSPQFSPDGARLAFVSNRGDHTFVGIFDSDGAPLKWMAPSTSRDLMPRWSPDGDRIAFVRIRGQGGPSETILQQHPNPWQIWVADTRTGEGHAAWKSPRTLYGSVPTSEGSANLGWAAGDRLTFLSDADGWPHLYSVPANGGSALLLTPGKFMAEYITLTPDRRALVYSANTGPLKDDVDRRHIWKVPVDAAKPVLLTPGTGNEAEPVVTGDGKTIAFVGGSAQNPPMATVVPIDGGAPATLAASEVPSDFPGSQFVAPKMVIFHSADGTPVHGQLFERPGGARKPAVVFVHGGPQRQMLLGFHYMWYYTNAYAVNQYLANHGYVVLSVNYRLGIGYGHDFHHPPHASAQGAAEYQDVKAGGLYLRSLPEVDAKRIGIWGGSYGGFLTAMALAKNSDIFATGVDLHGVHDWTTERARGLMDRERYEEAPDLKQALEVAWQSSPVSSIATWRSPVLLIQGDDDRNVRFHQTVDLARRLEEKGVPFDELVLPDEIHDFLRFASWLEVDQATVRWFDRHFMSGAGANVNAASAAR